MFNSYSAVFHFRFLLSANSCFLIKLKGMELKECCHFLYIIVFCILMFVLYETKPKFVILNVYSES